MKKIFHIFFRCPEKKRLSLAVVLAFLVFLPFIPTSGKVFWSRLLTPGQSIFDASGSWRRIYKAPMTINGARATLSIHGCDEPLELVRTRLKKCFNPAKENYFIGSGKPEAGNDNSFWILSAAHNRILRLLVLPMPGSGQSLVLAIDQTAAEFSKSAAVPQQGIFPGFFPLTESTVETIIRNEETGTALEMRIIDEAPEVMIGEISAKLSSQGWQQVYPQRNLGDSKERFVIFQRGEALCTILAGPALRENKSCVTILFKKKKGNKGE